MAAVETHIFDTAAEIVKRAQHRALSIRTELEQLETRKAEIFAEIHLTEVMSSRLSRFKVHDGISLQCPRCWIQEESINHLSLKQGGQWRHDYFVCDLCELEIDSTDK